MADKFDEGEVVWLKGTVVGDHNEKLGWVAVDCGDVQGRYTAVPADKLVHAASQTVPASGDLEARIQAEGVRVREECAKACEEKAKECPSPQLPNMGSCHKGDAAACRAVPLPTAAYEEAMLRARISEHHIFCELCTNMREPTDEKCCPSMKEMQRDLAKLAAKEGRNG